MASAGQTATQFQQLKQACSKPPYPPGTGISSFFHKYPYVGQASKQRPASDPAMESLEIGSAVYATRLTAKFKNREVWKRPDERRIEAFIPGTIQRIMAKEGQEVSAGSPLLILEAMKMRNEVLSPVDGKIRKIHVKEGEMVPKSHLLLEID